MNGFRYKFSGYLLVLMAIAVACNIYILIPLYPLIANEWEVTITQTVLGSSFFSFFYAFGLLTFGTLSEKFGRKQILTYGMLGGAVTTSIVAFAFNVETLYLFRAIQGFILGSFAPVAFAYCFDHFEERLRTLIIALINMGFLISGVVGPIISEFFGANWSWKASFFFFSCLYGILFFLAILFLLTSTPRKTKQSNVITQYRSLLLNKNLLYCYFIVLSLLMSFVAFYESLHRFYAGESMTIVKAVGLIGTLTSLMVGVLLKKFGAKTTIVIGFISMIISLVTINIWKLPLIISLFSVLFVASISLIIPSIISYIGTLGAKYRANAISLYSFTLLTGTAFGPIISDAFSFTNVLILLTCWALANIFFITRVKESTSDREAEFS